MRHTQLLGAALGCLAVSLAQGQCPLQQRVWASDGSASDFFGSAVALSGNTAVVGARNDDTVLGINAGSAYVFVQNGSVWNEQAHLVPSVGAPGDWFGVSVAIDGDTVVVGAYGYGTPEAGNCGSAFVFVRTGVVWTQQAQLLAADRAAGDSFGRSVAISGETIVVGASSDDTPAGSNAGSAYVFVRASGNWMQSAQLAACDSTASEFGYAVALTDDTLIVGAPGGVVGSAFVFQRVGGLWTEHAQCQAAAGTASGFGASVAIDNNTVIIGAPRSNQYDGAACIFEEHGSTWTQHAHFVNTDDATGEMFGRSVAIRGDRAIVGAAFGEVAFMYGRSGASWTEQARFHAWDGTIYDHFGYSVALTDEIALVGVHHGNAPGGAEAGLAFLYNLQRVFVVCDLNCDGSTNLFDIQPFLEGLTGNRYPCSTCAGDADVNGTVNQFDIQAFIACLIP